MDPVDNNQQPVDTVKHPQVDSNNNNDNEQAANV